MGNTLENELASMLNATLSGKQWLPSRKSGLFGQALLKLEHEIQRIKRQGTKKIDTTSGAAVVAAGGIPKQVISASATESPSTQLDRTFSQVAVSFTRDPSDKNFAGVHIWFTGYKGNNQPVLMTDASDSPAVFLCETTKENITVTVQPFNGGHVAAPFAGARTCSVALDGVVSAPAAPTVVTQTATIVNGATTLGQQFSFNFLPASVSDVVLGYWIYRVASHSAPTPPASRFKFVLHNNVQQGAYTFQDVSGVSTNFYYVSAVNKSGLESTLSDCAAGAGGTVTTYRPSSSATLVGDIGFSNPANVYDGNATTYAFAGAQGGDTYGTSWSGWSAAVGAPTSIKLKVTSQVGFVSGAAGTAKIEYSTNGGSTWTAIYSTSAGRTQQTDVVTLSTGQDLTQMKIRAVDFNNTSGRANQWVYEAWIEVTT